MTRTHRPLPWAGAVVGALMLGLAPRAAADVIRAAPERPHTVYAASGFDLSLATGTLGYARSFDVAGFASVVQAEIAAPLMRIDGGDVKPRLAARIELPVGGGRWLIPVQVGVSAPLTSNEAFSAVGVATDVTALPGYHGTRWVLAGELSWMRTWATHVASSDAYREWVYPQARDGWYGSAAQFERLGLRVGRAIGDHYAVLLRGGVEHHGAFDVVIPRAYAVLSASYGF
jgi:hypothetical protein